MAVTPAGLTLDRETHTYRMHGRVVPSVTQMLNSAGQIDTQWYTAESSKRGTDVHTICELDDWAACNMVATVDGLLLLGRSRLLDPLALDFLPAPEALTAWVRLAAASL